jgi:hypothetical protein
VKVVFHEDIYQFYTGDPAAASGRIEAIVETIEPHIEFVPAEPTLRQDIAAVHTEDYEEIGCRARSAADRHGGGCFAILEGGYNHEVRGENVLALIQSMAGR